MTSALILGLMTTVVIGWSIAHQTTFDPFERVGVQRYLTSAQHPRWMFAYSRKGGAARLVSFIYLSPTQTEDDIRSMSIVRPDLLPTWSQVMNLDPMVRPFELRIETATGWPFLCLKCMHEPSGIVVARRTKEGVLYSTTMTTNIGLGGLRYQSALSASDGGIIDSALPIKAIWSGLLFNTLLFACIWKCFISICHKAVLVSRRRRQLCIRCGYDLRGTNPSGCPECGWGREKESDQVPVKS
jgi:hypothetical protein